MIRTMSMPRASSLFCRGKGTVIFHEARRVGGTAGQTVCKAWGAVGPASPSGHDVEAPAAALFPLLARREFPKSRPLGGRSR